VKRVPLQGCPKSECRLTWVRMQWVHWTNCALCPLLAVSCGDTGLGLFTLTVWSPRIDCRFWRRTLLYRVSCLSVNNTLSAVRLRAGGAINPGSISRRRKRNFSVLRWFRGYPTSYAMSTGGSFTWTERHEREAHHSPPCRDDFKTTWSYISTSHSSNSHDA
jgi:hypothetical protein